MGGLGENNRRKTAEEVRRAGEEKGATLEWRVQMEKEGGRGSGKRVGRERMGKAVIKAS